MKTTSFLATVLLAGSCTWLAACSDTTLPLQKSASGDTALLQQLAGGGLDLASPQNVMGVLTWCYDNGYAPSASQAVKGKLMDKIGLDQRAEQSSDYKDGAIGILKDAQGGNFSLNSLSDTAGKKACGMIADQATSSLLGL